MRDDDKIKNITNELEKIFMLPREVSLIVDETYKPVVKTDNTIADELDNKHLKISIQIGEETRLVGDLQLNDGCTTEETPEVICKNSKLFFRGVELKWFEGLATKRSTSDDLTVKAQNTLNEQGMYRHIKEQCPESAFLVNYHDKIILDHQIKNKKPFTVSKIAVLSMIYDSDDALSNNVDGYVKYKSIQSEQHFDVKTLFLEITDKDNEEEIQRKLNFLLKLQLQGKKFNRVTLPDFILNLLADREAVEKKLKGTISGDQLRLIFKEAKNAHDERVKNNLFFEDRKMSCDVFNKLDHSFWEKNHSESKPICARGISVSGDAVFDYNFCEFDFRNAQFDKLTVKTNGLLTKKLYKGIRAQKLIVEKRFFLTKGKLQPITVKAFNHVVYEAELTPLKSKNPLKITMEIKSNPERIFFTSGDKKIILQGAEIKALYKKIKKEYRVKRNLPFFLNRTKQLEKFGLSDAENILSLIEYAKKNPKTATCSALYNVLNEKLNFSDALNAAAKNPDLYEDIQLNLNLNVTELSAEITSKVFSSLAVKKLNSETTDDKKIEKDISNVVNAQIKEKLLHVETIKNYLLSHYVDSDKNDLPASDVIVAHLNGLLSPMLSVVNLTASSLKQDLEKAYQSFKTAFPDLASIQKIEREVENYFDENRINQLDLANSDSISDKINTAYAKLKGQANPDLNIFILDRIKKCIKHELLKATEQALITAEQTGSAISVISELTARATAAGIVISDGDIESVSAQADVKIKNFKNPLTEINKLIVNDKIDLVDFKGKLNALILHIHEKAPIRNTLNLLVELVDDLYPRDIGPVFEKLKSILKSVEHGYDFSVFTSNGDETLKQEVDVLNTTLTEFKEKKEAEKKAISSLNSLVTEGDGILDRCNHLSASSSVAYLRTQLSEVMMTLSKLNSANTDLTSLQFEDNRISLQKALPKFKKLKFLLEQKQPELIELIDEKITMNCEDEKRRVEAAEAERKLDEKNRLREIEMRKAEEKDRNFLLFGKFFEESFLIPFLIQRLDDNKLADKLIDSANLLLDYLNNAEFTGCHFVLTDMNALLGLFKGQYSNQSGPQSGNIKDELVAQIILLVELGISADDFHSKTNKALAENRQKIIHELKVLIEKARTKTCSPVHPKEVFGISFFGENGGGSAPKKPPTSTISGMRRK